MRGPNLDGPGGAGGGGGGLGGGPGGPGEVGLAQALAQARDQLTRVLNR
jgi:hypothetical protein